MQDDEVTPHQRGLTGVAALGFTGTSAYFANQLRHAGAGPALLLGSAFAGIGLGALLGAATLRDS